MAEQLKVKQEDCFRFVDGQCELGYQACALTMYYPDCRKRKTKQIDKRARNDNNRQVKYYLSEIRDFPFFARLSMSWWLLFGRKSDLNG